MNPCGWNIINCILSIWTYINTSMIFLPTILLSLLFSLSSTLFRTFQSLWIIISSCSYLAITWLVGITFVSLITYSAISFPVTLIISPNNLFTFCSSFNLKAFVRQQLHENWPYMGSLIVCSCVFWATVPHPHFRSGSGFKPNCCQTGGPSCQ